VAHKKESTTLRYVKCGAQEGYDAVANAAALKHTAGLLGKRVRKEIADTTAIDNKSS